MERARLQGVTHAELYVRRRWRHVLVELTAFLPLLDGARGAIGRQVEEAVIVVAVFLPAHAAKHVEKILAEQPCAAAQLQHRDRPAIVELFAVGKQHCGCVFRKASRVVHDKRDVVFDEGQESGAIPVQFRQLPFEARGQWPELLKHVRLSAHPAERIPRIQCALQFHARKRNLEWNRDTGRRCEFVHRVRLRFIPHNCFDPRGRPTGEATHWQHQYYSKSRRRARCTARRRSCAVLKYEERRANAKPTHTERAGET